MDCAAGRSTWQSATCIYYLAQPPSAPPRPAPFGCCICSRLKCHQRKNKWQQFSINCICAKLSSILASEQLQLQVAGPVQLSSAPVAASAAHLVAAGVAKLH